MLIYKVLHCLRFAHSLETKIHVPSSQDSGGPLMISDTSNNNLLYRIGITSFGMHCASSTRITSYLDWIERVTPLAKYCIQKNRIYFLMRWVMKKPTSVPLDFHLFSAEWKQFDFKTGESVSRWLANIFIQMINYVIIFWVIHKFHGWAKKSIKQAHWIIK